MNSVVLPLYGPLSVHLYGICVAAGIVLTLFLAHRSSFVADRIPTHLLLPLVNAVILAGIIGGRLLFVCTEWDEMHSWGDVVAVWDGGFSVLGSIIAGLVTIFFFVRHHRLSLLATLDVAGLYGPLVQAFGRIGCFFAGCCHGTPTNAWWAVTYTSPLVNPDCVPLHPTQLYNSTLLFALFLIQLHLVRRAPPAGLIGAFGFGGLGFTRFITDFWRADHVPWLLGLSVSQLLSLILLGFAVGIGVTSARRTRRQSSSL